jgi:four helix bundle protein
MDLASAVHRHTSDFPPEERYGLTSQMRRAAVSVPSNLAESYGRGGLDYARFVSIAYGSLLERETQVELAPGFEYAAAEPTTELLGLCSEVGKMLNGLRASLAIRRARPEPRTLTPEP